MRAVIQRVTAASVSVDGVVAGACGPGLLVLLGVADGDQAADADRLAGKVARLRLFENDDGKFDRALLDTGGEALVVSQFTLIADTSKGNRPSFSAAARPEVAEPLVRALLRRRCAGSASRCRPACSGRAWQVELVNDGPVTIVLDSESHSRRRTAAVERECSLRRERRLGRRPPTRRPSATPTSAPRARVCARSAGAPRDRCYPFRTAFHLLGKWALRAHFC